jgi:hypothetical protein
MNDKGCGRKRSRPNLKYYLGIFSDGLWKAMNSRPQGPDLIPGPHEYEAGVLTSQSRRFVLEI